MGIDVNEQNIICKHCDNYNHRKNRCELNKNPYEDSKECNEALAKVLAERIDFKSVKPKSKFETSKRNFKRGKLRKRQTAARK